MISKTDVRHAVESAVGAALRLREPAFLDRPVFVVACGRSGSTALCNGLGAHPQVLMAGEAPLIHKFGEAAHDYACGQNPQYAQKTVALESGRLRRELRRLSYTSALGLGLGLDVRPRHARRRTSALTGGRHLRSWGAKAFPAEKAAEGLLWLFPQAKFVYLFRNGLDVVQSMTKFGSFSELEFERRCRFWSDRVFRYDYLRHHERAETVRFEQFVEDDAATFERLLDHLALPPDAAPARFTSTTLVHPLDQPTAQADPKAELAKRGRAYEAWTDEQKEVFKRVCSDAMAHLGYDVPF